MRYSEDEYLMLSGIQHFAYCRRQWALIHMEQMWTDDSRTSAGTIFHQNVDTGRLEKRGDKWITRSISVSSPELGLSGQCDVVELTIERDDSGNNTKVVETTPVEYKVGSKKASDCDRIQLCAQAMCLESTLHIKIEKGYLFYGKSKRREEVRLTEELRQKTSRLAEEMHSVFKSGILPQENIDHRCNGCSMIDDCMPNPGSFKDVAEYISSMECFDEATAQHPVHNQP